MTVKKDSYEGEKVNVVIYASISPNLNSLLTVFLTPPRKLDFFTFFHYKTEIFFRVGICLFPPQPIKSDFYLVFFILMI